jgi:hypothetical protein
MALFKREDGFFVGAILANVVTTELVILLVCFFFLLIIGADYERVLVLLFIMALIFPVAFYHHSWSLCRSTTPEISNRILRFAPLVTILRLSLPARRLRAQ